MKADFTVSSPVREVINKTPAGDIRRQVATLQPPIDGTVTNDDGSPLAGIAIKSASVVITISDVAKFDTFKPGQTVAVTVG